MQWYVLNIFGQQSILRWQYNSYKAQGGRPQALGQAQPALATSTLYSCQITSTQSGTKPAVTWLPCQEQLDPITYSWARSNYPRTHSRPVRAPAIRPLSLTAPDRKPGNQPHPVHGIYSQRSKSTAIIVVWVLKVTASSPIQKSQTGGTLCPVVMVTRTTRQHSNCEILSFSCDNVIAPYAKWLNLPFLKESWAHMWRFGWWRMRWCVRWY